MNVERVLAMLTAHRADPTAAPGSSPDSMHPADVAAALAALRPPEGAQLLLARATGKVASYGDLEERFTQQVVAIARRELWQRRPGVPPLEGYRLLTRVALAEWLLPEKCKKCAGRLVRFSRKVHADVRCERCGGSGVERASGREVAHNLELHHSTFQAIWRARYDAVYALITDTYYQAERQLAAALHDRRQPA